MVVLHVAPASALKLHCCACCCIMDAQLLPYGCPAPLPPPTHRLALVDDPYFYFTAVLLLPFGCPAPLPPPTHRLALVDDPLSAVDVEVADKMFSRGVLQELLGRGQVRA